LTIIYGVRPLEHVLHVTFVPLTEFVQVAQFDTSEEQEAQALPKQTEPVEQTTPAVVPHKHAPPVKVRP